MTRAVTVVVACLVAAATPAAAHEAVFVISGDQLPASRAAMGHVQEVTVEGDGSARVRVATSMAPLRVRASYPLAAPTAAVVPAGFRLPGGLADALAAESQAWAAATEVLRWVAAHLAEDSHDRGPQDATSVLARRRGRCSGLANATAALLIAAGFEARTVSGLLIGDEVVVPHRWVECRLPGVGWVPTDPTLGFWVVTARHVAFASAVTVAPRVTIESASDAEEPYLPILDGRPLRPNEGAGLVCRLPSPRGGMMAVLSGAGGEVHRARLDPEARFEDLLPGRWELKILDRGEVVEQSVLELTAGVVHSFAVRD